jgi:hypothetical protein
VAGGHCHPKRTPAQGADLIGSTQALSTAPLTVTRQLSGHSLLSCGWMRSARQGSRADVRPARVVNTLAAHAHQPPMSIRIPAGPERGIATCTNRLSSFPIAPFLPIRAPGDPFQAGSRTAV